MNDFLKEIQKREQLREAGQPFYTDAYVLEQFYKKIVGEAPSATRSHVSNNFFEKNYDRYVQKGEKDNTPYHVFIDR